MAEAISDKNIIPTPPLEASSEFALPLDLDAPVKYNTDDHDDEDSALNEIENEEYTVDIEDVSGTGTNTIQPSVPQGIRVASQKIKFAPDGTAFVDVVLEFTAIKGATRYEVRIGT